MELYIGGAWQGKLDYVLKKKSRQMQEGERLNAAEPMAALTVLDGKTCNAEVQQELRDAAVLNHLHLLIQRRLQAGLPLDCLIEQIYAVNSDMILICDEVGLGIVPLTKEDRQYREAVGRVLCQAAQQSDVVERILGGIGMRIK